MKLLTVITIVLLLCLPLVGQTLKPVTPDFSKVELSVGYDRLFNNITIADLSPGNLQKTWLSGLNGGDIGITWNLNSVWGIKADVAGNTQSGPFATSGKNYSFAVGPVIKKHSGAFNPFAEVLVGFTHQNIEGGFAGLKVTSGQNAFTGIAGGGVDFKLSKNVSIRAIEADMVWTAYHNQNPLDPLIVSSRQLNARVVSGLVFTF